MAREPDPRGELKKLERALSAELPPGLVLRGPERWFRSRAADKAREAARAAGFELCAHDAKGPEFELTRLLDDLVGSALFAPARLVVIENPEDLLKKDGRKDSSTTRAVKSFLEGERGTVVLSSKSIRADAGAVKAIVAAGGLMLSFRKFWDAPPPWEKSADPRSTELVAWIVERSRELGAPLSPDRAALLAKRTGNELDAVESALRSLESGGAGDELPLADESAAGSPFKVADDLVAGRVGQVVAGLDTLYRGGMRKEKDGTREHSAAALFAILMGTVRGRVRDGLAVSQAMERGAGFKPAADAVGVSPAPMVRDRLEELLAGRRAADWRRMLDDVLALERRARTGVTVDASDLTRLALRWRRTKKVHA
jgi:DNA polymerase III delta subunit